MASGLSAYAEKKLLDLLLGGTAFSAPATLYAALLVGGTEVSTSGTNYSRVAITNNTTNFPNQSVADPYTKRLATQLTFATPSASWGTPDNLRLYDAASGGNEIAKASITVPTAIATDYMVYFAANALAFTLRQT